MGRKKRSQDFRLEKQGGGGKGLGYGCQERGKEITAGERMRIIVRRAQRVPEDQKKNRSQDLPPRKFWRTRRRRKGKKNLAIGGLSSPRTKSETCAVNRD